MKLRSVQIVTGELEENCYLLWKDGSADAIVFDPGAEPKKISQRLQQDKLSIAGFLQTHCHFDHIGALGDLKAANAAAPLYVPRAEEEWLERPTLNLSYFFGQAMTGPKPDHLVDDNDVITVGGFSFKALLVPGHSPGSTAYFIEDPSGPPHVFCGDILFAGSIGRTDLPGGSGEEVLIEGIRSRLFALPENTIVHPGHGPETTIGREMRDNPLCGSSV